MIFLSYEGGLGNQMFQYAFGRFIEKRFEEEVVYDTSKYLHEKIEFRDFELNSFNISKEWKHAETRKSRVSRFGILYYFYLVITSVYLLVNKKRRKRDAKLVGVKIYQFITNKLGFYRVHFNEKLYLFDSLTRKKIVRGMWFYPDIVKSLGEELKDELTVITPLNLENEGMLNEIRSTNSVGVHIRRGDYVQLGLVICDIEYYKRCMKRMADLVDNPVFYIFSDDIDWVKANLDTPYRLVFVDNHNSAPEDMRLFYSCHHFIMSNSTFSWWGAYLGRCPDKKVIVPEIWAKGAKPSTLIMDDWLVEKTV